MNNDILKGNWNQIKGRVRQHWAKLTDDEVEKTHGNINELRGMIQEKYGLTRDEVNLKLNEFLDLLKIKMDS